VTNSHHDNLVERNLQRQTTKLVDEYVERLGDIRLGQDVTFDDSFVCLSAAYYVILLDGHDFLDHI